MIIREIKWRDPMAAFSPLAGKPFAHILHGGRLNTEADWSIIVAIPEEVLTTDGMEAAKFFDKLSEKLEERKRGIGTGLKEVPFASGAVGYIGYEASKLLERSLELPPSPFSIPDASIGFYDAAAIFSRRRRRAFVVGREDNACRRLQDILGKEDPQLKPMPRFEVITSNFTNEYYQENIAAVIEDIRNGDYYQANISHQISTKSLGQISPFDLFQRLAGKSDAAFGALLQFTEGAVISNSPERFFRIENDLKRRVIRAEPIKGTRPRGQTQENDIRLAEKLLADPKDRAENIMIADLIRNDLSKICCDGSIREEAICELLSLANVHHLVSRISGELRPGIAIQEIFSALFPCGSVTGAPKIEAMKAISRIEKAGRGPYCGAIGYIDDRGNSDFSVAIRTMIYDRKTNSLTLPVGGGVTLRSDPRLEYLETMVKARSFLQIVESQDFQES